MKYLNIFEKFRMPSYNKIKHIKWGELKIDLEKCTGCKLCEQACPADSIIVIEKKAKMRPTHGYPGTDTSINQCIFCGDCMAICPANAIELAVPYNWKYYYKSINRGEIELPRL